MYIFYEDDKSLVKVKKCIKYMESQGLVFKKKAESEGNGCDNFAILGSGTSVGYRKGIDKIVLFCGKDGTDAQNINEKLGYPIKANTRKERPYKLELSQDEFIKAVEILVQNPKNRQ